MTRHRTTLGMIVAAAILVALPSASLADPAAQEYLPQVSESGVDGSGPADQDKGGDDRNAVLPVSDSGGSGGDSSGSILLNPIVLLMIAGVIAAAVAVTLRRRRGDEAEAAAGAESDVEARRSGGGSRTPDGEIIGPDQAG